MKNKTRLLLILICTISCAILIGIGLCRAIVIHNHLWKYSADFNNYSKDFIAIKDYVLLKYSDNSKKWISVSVTDEHGRTFYDPDINNCIEIPDDIRVSLETICDFGFPNENAVLDVIRINENRVSFCIENGRYALVYSPGGEPEWINFPDEVINVKVKKIGDGWYHVTENK